MNCSTELLAFRALHPRPTINTPRYHTPKYKYYICKNITSTTTTHTTAHLVTGNKLEHAVASNNNKTVVLRHVQHQLLRLRENADALSHRVPQAPEAQQQRKTHQRFGGGWKSTPVLL